MKRVLILVMSTDMAGVQGIGPKYHYRALAETSLATWDSIDVPGVETIFYFGRSGKSSTDKILYTDAEDEGLLNMGHKLLAAMRYALDHRPFEYIFLANSSLYIDKPGLLRYVQSKAAEKLAIGICAPDGLLYFLWGPSRLLSRDVVTALVANSGHWDHTIMEDVALSRVLCALGISIDCRGSMGSIGNTRGCYDIMFYEDGISGGATFTNFDEMLIALPDQFCFRVKDDANRENDIHLMKELHHAYVQHRLNQT